MQWWQSFENHLFHSGAPSNLQAAFCTWPVSWKIFQFLSKEHKCWTWSIEKLNIKMIAKHRIMFYCPIFNGLKSDIWKRKSHILATYSNYHFNALIDIHTKPFQPCWCENLVFHNLAVLHVVGVCTELFAHQHVNHGNGSRRVVTQLVHYMTVLL